MPLIYLLASLMLISVESALARENSHQVDSKEPVIWSYKGASGADHWAELSSRYSACNGTSQSPVVIDQVERKLMPGIQVHYFTSTLNIRHDPVTLKLAYDPGSYVEIAEKKYQLVDVDFHLPGEHALFGKIPDMEIHLRHVSNDGRTLILAVPVISGYHRNPTLKRVFDNVPGRYGASSNSRIGFNALFLIPGNKRHYVQYQGSETRPPCEEDVRWILFTHPLKSSSDELLRLRELINPNARPFQQLNGRKVIQANG